jgi:tetratricopeptide (TPR) repeat protein
MSIHVGYPPYVGFYLTACDRVFFTKKTAEIGKRSYALKIPLCNLPKGGLFSKTNIHYLLREGFVPSIGKEVTFVQTNEDRMIEQLMESCDMVIAESLKDDLLCDLLRDFKSRLGEKKFDLALENIEEAYMLSPKVKELYANYLFFLKKPKASIFFLQLAEEKKEEGLQFLEKAVMCNPDNFKIDKKHFSSEQRINLYLIAFLHLYKVDRGKAMGFYQKALECDPNDPMIFLAYLSCLEKGKQRWNVRLQLADLFISLGENKTARCFIKKNLKEGGSFEDRIKLQETPRVKIEQMLECKPSPVKKELRYVVLEEEAKPILVNRKVKRGFLKLIESHIEKRDYVQAQEALEQAIEKCGERSSFYKRLFIICKAEKKRSATGPKKTKEHLFSHSKARKAAIGLLDPVQSVSRL